MCKENMNSSNDEDIPHKQENLLDPFPQVFRQHPVIAEKLKFSR